MRYNIGLYVNETVLELERWIKQLKYQGPEGMNKYRSPN